MGKIYRFSEEDSKKEWGNVFHSLWNMRECKCIKSLNVIFESVYRRIRLKFINRTIPFLKRSSVWRKLPIEMFWQIQTLM